MITRGVQTQTNSVSATKTRGSRTFSEAISQETNFSNESNYKEFTTTLPITAAASTVVADVESPLVPPPKRRGRPPKSSIISAENQAVEAADRTATSGREERKSSPTRTTTTTTTTRRRAGAAPASTTHTWPSKPVSDRLLALEMKVPRIPKPAKAGDFGPTTDGPPVNLSDMHPLVQEVVSSMEQVRSQQQGIAISRYMRFLFPYLGAQRPVMQKARCVGFQSCTVLYDECECECAMFLFPFTHAHLFRSIVCNLSLLFYISVLYTAVPTFSRAGRSLHLLISSVLRRSYGFCPSANISKSPLILSSSIDTTCPIV